MRADGPIPPDLVVFDMDRTLVKGRVAHVMGDALGVKDQVDDIIRKRQEGVVDGIEAARRIARLWKGQAWSRFEPLIEAMPLNPGADEAIQTLSQHGIPTAILTDSYLQAAEVARRRVKADAALGLMLLENKGRLTGEIRQAADLPEGDLSCEYSFLCKEKGIKALAERLGARLERTVMVGDSDPDACAMRVVGHGIAYRPLGERVKRHATRVLGTDDLRGVLTVLRIADAPPTS